MMLGSSIALVLPAAAPAPAAPAPAAPVVEFTPFQDNTLVLNVPKDWKSSVVDGSQRFTDPSGDAYLLLDVGKVQSAGMKPQVCLDKIVAAMGGQDSKDKTGWTLLSLGRAPAARHLDVDTTPDRTGSVETVTYVGCDGKTTWSLVFHMDAKRKEHFEPLAEKISTSVAYAYAKAPPGQKAP